MPYVNKIKKGNALHDVHDARIPEVSASDSGKFLAVDENGHIIVKEKGGSSNELH